jgi:hypothetical protein
VSDEAEACPGTLDQVFGALLRAGENRRRAREILGQIADERLLVALLRRAVPAAFLEELAAAPPWSERPRVLARVVLSPRVPRPLALRLVGSLHWRDLAEVAATLRLSAALRVRAESSLRDALPDMRLGDRVTLARLATPALLAELLRDADRRVLEAALTNPRLREEDLLIAIRRDDVRVALLEQVVGSTRWTRCYAVRLALALQPRTPLALALQQVSALVPRDLRRVAGAAGLHPLVASAARTVLERDEA